MAIPAQMEKLVCDPALSISRMPTRTDWGLVACSFELPVQSSTIGTAGTAPECWSAPLARIRGFTGECPLSPPPAPNCGNSTAYIWVSRDC